MAKKEIETQIKKSGKITDDTRIQSTIPTIKYLIDNGSKVIIVSHLPSMKDQFPVHFVVEKGSHGSSVRVVEQA